MNNLIWGGGEARVRGWRWGGGGGGEGSGGGGGGWWGGVERGVAATVAKVFRGGGAGIFSLVSV